MSSGRRDAPPAVNKWASRVLTSPLHAVSISVPQGATSRDIAALPVIQEPNEKENCRPLTGGTWNDVQHVTRGGLSQHSCTADDTLSLLLNNEPSAPSGVLGKRRKLTETSTALLQAVYVLDEDEEEDATSEKRRRDAVATANAVMHFDARASELHGHFLGRQDAEKELEKDDDDEVETLTRAGGSTLFVNDCDHMAHLHFGTVAYGERKSRHLTLENASEVGNARVKYDGYTMIEGKVTTSAADAARKKKRRFKCDLDVCVVDALKSVMLRVTFEPRSVDVGHHITAMLKFTVNDQLGLQCRATGAVTPRVPKLLRLEGMRSSLKPAGTVVEAVNNNRQVSSRTLSERVRKVYTVSSALTLSDLEPERAPVVKTKQNVGNKRHSSVVIDFSHLQDRPKRRKSKLRKSAQKIFSPSKISGVAQDPILVKKPFSGSWWKQRQEAYDENWMAKQIDGFTKWLNYVLLDGSALCSSGGDERSDVEEHVTRTKSKLDYASLRVLSQKRMESKWVQAAVDLYQRPSMNDVLFNLQDEIGSQRLMFRADRPVYADVGLQEELISLLNNYHPVWLGLGLYVVLGNQVMRQESCSLRMIFRAYRADSTVSSKNGLESNQKMPHVLRRIILKHLVKDSHVAENYRLVQNLMAPLDGSAADRHDGGNAFINTRKNVNGREYFDSLTQSFMLKFFMLVFFLDRAIEQKGHKFAHFPCLFRIARVTKTTVPSRTKSDENNKQLNNTNGGDGKVWVKNSQTFLTEFCRLFLASEGRVDKHLKRLGYTLNHEQTALDEIDLEVRNLETDLRDGIRLAKLMEALTAPVSSSADQGGKNVPKPRGLSTFLRVPALSRLQKVHNVEICLHFLRDKCGASVLDNLRSSSWADKKRMTAGRVRVSSSGFAGLQTKVDEKMVENLAKDIVNGHREKTLALLRKLISSFQLRALVDAETMRREISNVVKRMSFRAKDFFDQQCKNVPLIYDDEHECYSLLLEWCRAVCANYDVGVNDFSGSFADGKALCYLLHYYHPMLLSRSDILPTTNDLHDGDTFQVSERVLLSNEQQHFAIVNDRIRMLGEVPVLMPQQYNTKNPPEEKMTVTFVCYLQSRLMDSYNEIHAAFSLKRWWKSPLIRLRMHRKKNLNARIIQRFWYTSSQKRLAVRQCRKLLRAAYLVKSAVLSRVVRRHFLRLRKAAIKIQMLFRAHQQVRVHGNLLHAAQAIQRFWRNQLQWRHEKRMQIMQRKVTQRELVKASCATIERMWLQYLSREGARLVRQQTIVDRHVAVSRIQFAYRQSRLRAAAQIRRMQAWRQHHHAAYVIQTAWVAFVRHREESQRVLALQRFEQLMEEKKWQQRQITLRRKVETRAAVCVQKRFRQFVFRKREAVATKLASTFRGMKQKWQFQAKKHAAVVLQHNVRIWRRRRQLSALVQFYSMLETYRQLKVNEEQRRILQIQELKSKTESRAVRCIQFAYRMYRFQKRLFAATRIESVVRAWLASHRYSRLRASACLLQKNVRIWRRRKQVQVLLRFQGLLLRYRRMQRDAEEQQERVRRKRLQRIQETVKHRAACRIQSAYRWYTFHKRVLAAILIQAVFRGFKEKQQYATIRVSVAMMQRSVRHWMAVTRFRRALGLHRASVSIQRCARGWISRRCRFSFYTLQTQLKRLCVLMSCWRIEYWYANRMLKYRKKRMLVVRSHWTRFRTSIVQKRVADANKIGKCWRSSCFRSFIKARIQERQQMVDAAQRIQIWWLELCCKWVQRLRYEELQQQREMEAIALAMAKVRAERIVVSWLYDKVILPNRERKFHLDAVQKIQAWWRGMLVRLHHSTLEITWHRKRLSAIQLVGSGPHGGVITLSKGPQELEVKSCGGRSVPTEQPQTLGSRLDTALHMLLHGKRLQDMLFASHTIEVCTRYSRECCHKCVQLQISSTIFAAIRGLNRSRPHVELLHQLLLVLKNLTVYRRSTDKGKPVRVVATDEDKNRLDVDLRALDTLVDLLHIHRDMHHVFVLSAEVIAYYFRALKPLVGKNTGVQESWHEAEKRLGGLQELLSRKLALYTATASFRRVNQLPEKNSANSLMRKMNPKTAVSIMQQLVVLL
uniref:Calponin-homology (CH) domain-containing protein n=1 Tax=Peronospora matthiolae TaxID=2874970 RepID=A0AAV1V2L0_9STRA